MVPAARKMAEVTPSLKNPTYEYVLVLKGYEFRPLFKLYCSTYVERLRTLGFFRRRVVTHTIAFHDVGLTAVLFFQAP